MRAPSEALPAALRVSLGEGGTPLVPSAAIGPRMGAQHLRFKLETCNPSGSYKDRFVAAEVARMQARGVRACIATSSGNTGSSLAAYCARAGIRCAIVVNKNAPAGKLAQMQAHGAHVLRVPGFITDPDTTAAVFTALEEMSARREVPLVISAFRYCPEGMSAVSSIARELAGECAPRHVFVPVGGGGLYSATVQGFEARGAEMPRVHAVQPAGCLTAVGAWQRGDSEIRPVRSATAISGLAVPGDLDASRALGLLRRSGGLGIAVEDAEVYAAQQLLLETEGIYTEPAGAASVAGWLSACRGKLIDPAEPAVCLITGHGFKDPDSVAAAALRHPDAAVPAASLRATIEELIGECGK